MASWCALLTERMVGRKSRYDEITELDGDSGQAVNDIDF